MALRDHLDTSRYIGPYVHAHRHLALEGLNGLRHTSAQCYRSPSFFLHCTALVTHIALPTRALASLLEERYHAESRMPTTVKSPPMTAAQRVKSCSRELPRT
eukprot:scaffold17296_cov145-Isochrysis_galbana.AAC.1